ncbi:MAG: hypothetical protein AAB899_02435 [Patescibacteria group bacterium]
MDEFNRVNDAGQNQTTAHASRSGVGSIVGAIIIIILLAAGAFYFWGAELNTRDNNPPPLILGNETAGADTQAATQ